MRCSAILPLVRHGPRSGSDDHKGTRRQARRTLARVFGTTVALAWGLTAGHALALEAGPQDVYVRVVDVGAGLCTITEAPGGHYMVYDAGRWTGNWCMDAAAEIVDGENIDLMVISHPDADHLGEADDILDAFSVAKIIRTGFPRWDTASWQNWNDAAAQEARFGATIINLQTTDLDPGTELALGEATVTFVAGWGRWEGSGPTSAERRNVISVVVRLTYRGGSILFTGDTIGRRLGDDDDACKDAEAVMVQRAATVPIEADAIIAPHHGGNNGSSTCFIEAVDPTFVVFSAGHDHEHPTADAAGRYLAHGVALDNIFRTDRGDDEGGFEWAEGRVNGCNDRAGDDDVEIVIRSDGTAEAGYRLPSTGC